MKISGEQTRLRNLLESLQITSEWIDITTDPLVRQKMREECGNPKAMPPQIFNDFRYLGDVSDLEEFVEQGKTREWFGMGDVANNDVTTTSLSNGINTDGTIKEVIATVVEARLQDSPTSSVENHPDISPPKSKTDILPPSRTAVLSAAGAFEAMLKNPPVNSFKPKVVFTQSRATSTNTSENKTALDEDRKLRILGISSAENSAINGAENEQAAR